MTTLHRNWCYGALGFAIPTVVVFVAYPVLVRRLGPEAFGLYVLATSISGSLAFLEFGFSTATIKFVAEKLGHGDRDAAAETITASLVFYAGLGALSVLIFWLAAPLLAKWSGVSGSLRLQAATVFRLAALQFLFAYVTGVWVAALKGMQRFDLSTAFITLLTALSWGGAIAGVMLGGFRVVGVTAIGVAANAAVCLASWGSTARLCRMRGIHHGWSPPRIAIFREMLHYGFFMSLNGIASLLMRQVVQILLANTLSAAAVAAYATAVQVVSRVNALMNALFESLLPVASGLSGRGPRANLRYLRALYSKALLVSLVGSVALAGALCVSAPYLISVWLRSSISKDVVLVVQISCAGLAINGATPVIYHFINGIGYPQYNTLFIIGNPILFYAMLGVLSWHGATLAGFAIAGAAALAVNGIGYLVFCELIVWRRVLQQRGEVIAEVQV